MSYTLTCFFHAIYNTFIWDKCSVRKLEVLLKSHSRLKHRFDWIWFGFWFFQQMRRNWYSYLCWPWVQEIPNAYIPYNACTNSRRKEDKNKQFFYEWEFSHILLCILFYHTRAAKWIHRINVRSNVIVYEMLWNSNIVRIKTGIILNVINLLPMQNFIFCWTFYFSNQTKQFTWLWWCFVAPIKFLGMIKDIFIWLYFWFASILIVFNDK